MTGFNRVVLVGHLTRNPELRTIPTGSTVADLGLATNERYRNKAGETVESTCFVDVVTWGRQAESCAKYLEKGSAILVEGRLQLDQWQSSEGQKRSKLKVRAERVRFMGSARGHSPVGAEPPVMAAAVAAGAASGEANEEPMPF